MQDFSLAVCSVVFPTVFLFLLGSCAMSLGCGLHSAIADDSSFLPAYVCHMQRFALAVAFSLKGPALCGSWMSLYNINCTAGLSCSVLYIPCTFVQAV
jgi:hypothetical protein